ncbi:hypothetical protein A3Q56_06125 [Intoshia linei]|uniref:Uncharacterized protein n=1 Tax=Intoshia linei TaxID=1819745 RepID=A0A177AXL5_9BILA|nr:hypothetical protein A3Q56_06125 [Intoshia linei]
MVPIANLEFKLQGIIGETSSMEDCISINAPLVIECIINTDPETISQSCQHAKCPIQTCNAHRDGVLCEKCQTGYSEAMFSKKCILNEDCLKFVNLLIIIILSGILYTILLMYQEEIRNFLFAHDKVSKWIISNTKKTHYKNTNKINPDKENVQNKNVKIYSNVMLTLLYYFQDAKLIVIDSIYPQEFNNDHTVLIDKIITDLFRFRVEPFIFFRQFCFIRNVTHYQKILIISSVIPYVYIIFGFLFVIMHILEFICVKKILNIENSQKWKNKIILFKTRIIGGLVMAVLLNYQNLTQYCLTLLKCLPMKGSWVLHVQSSIKCYTTGQYVLIIFAVFCLIPFFIVLLYGTILLKNDQIGTFQLIVAFLLPAPSIGYWILQKKFCNAKILHKNNVKTLLSNKIVNVLEGPFRETKLPILGTVCPHGILFFRRFLIVVFFTSIINPLSRTVSLFIVLLLFLIQHIYSKPYKDNYGNFYGTLTSTFLVCINAINIAKAAFEISENTSKLDGFINVIRYVEYSLISFTSAIVAVIIIVLFVYRLIYKIFQLF